MSHVLVRRAMVGVLCLAGGLVSARAASADDVTLPQILEQRAPAIVTLKYVEKGDTDSTGEIAGVLVDPAGLILFYGDDVGKVASLKAMFGNDPTENEAVLVAHDAVTGFSFAQVLDLPGGKPLPFVDLTQGAEPGIGQSLVGVSRLARGFDFAPTIRRLYITAKIEVPRLLWDFEGTFFGKGLPVFDLQGRPVGVMGDQAPAKGSGEDEDQVETFIWPLKDVLHSVEQAKKRIPDALAKAKEKKKDEAADKKDDDEKKDKDGEKKDGEKPKEGEKPDPTKPGNGEKPAGPK